MQRIKRVLKLIFRNLYYYRVDFIRNFAIVRIVQAFIILPLITLLISLTMDITGVQTITENNIMVLLAHPFAIFTIILILLIAILFIYYEMGFLMLMAYHQQRAIPYTWKGLWKRLNGKVVYFVSLQTLLIVLYSLLLIPLISSILPISIFQNLQIPRFIVDELLNSRDGTILYVGVLIVLGFIGLRFIFTWPFFVVYQWMSIWEAMKLSWQFSKKKLLDTIGMLGFILVVHVSLILLTMIVVFIPLFVIEKIVPSWSLVTAGFTLTLAEGVIIVFFSILQVIFSQLLVMVAFQLTHHKPLIVQEESFRLTIRQWSLLIAIYAFFLVSGMNILNLQRTVYEPDTLVIAHRGFMERGVENTISSIEASAKAGAEMVEIDVQQTKDGQFVVFHDATLSRLAGRSGTVKNMTLDELTSVTVSAGGLSDTIPSLAQVLEVSRQLNIKLLIEIKTHGNETDDFLERLIALLNDFDALDVHYVQSLNLPLMDELEALEPRIITGLVFAIAYGSLPKTDSDFIAIEQYFATGRIIDQIRSSGKKLFVWTVNDTRGMQKYYEQNVDGIITNHPDTAVEIRNTFDEQKNFVRRIANKIQITY